MWPYEQMNAADRGWDRAAWAILVRACQAIDQAWQAYGWIIVVTALVIIGTAK